MRIHELLGRSARLHGPCVAVEDGGKRITFAALERAALEWAVCFGEAGLGAGSRIAILSRNRWEYVAAYFACSASGAVLVPLNWRLRPNEIEAQLLDAKAEALIAEAQLAAALDGSPSLKSMRLCELLPTLDEHPAPAGFAHYDAAAGSRRPAPLAPDPGAADPTVVQMYTSGTTGLPKGALITHRNLTSLVAAWLFDMPLLAQRDRFLQVTPLFHVGGLVMLLSNVWAGTTLVLHPEFAPEPALRSLGREGITQALLVPAMLQWLLNEPASRGARFPDLRLLVYGAAPMPEALLAEASERLDCGFLQGYGLTETAGVLTSLRPEDHLLRDSSGRRLYGRCAGRAVLCSDVRIFDATNKELCPGELGEVVARGPNISPGYFGQAEASAEALHGGWFHTGDLGFLDETGMLTLVDRQKDMILVGGENVYPREIELRLLEHPAVADCAVIGIPHPVWGEEVCACVVQREGESVPAQALIQHCRARLARFKCPTRVEWSAALPRNAAGKLQKNLLRDPFWRGRERQV